MIEIITLIGIMLITVLTTYLLRKKESIDERFLWLGQKRGKPLLKWSNR